LLRPRTFSGRLTGPASRGDHVLKRNGGWVEASFRFSLLLGMIFSENRYPPRIEAGAGFFGIML